MDRPWERSETDYLNILTENPDFCASEYDNIELLFHMIEAGTLRLVEGKNSRHLSLVTTIYCELTAAGRAARDDADARRHEG